MPMRCWIGWILRWLRVLAAGLGSAPCVVFVEFRRRPTTTTASNELLMLLFAVACMHSADILTLLLMTL